LQGKTLFKLAVITNGTEVVFPAPFSIPSGFEQILQHAFLHGNRSVQYIVQTFQSLPEIPGYERT
jgi:hypothetical protein